MTAGAFDAGALIRDVFAPTPGERVAILIDHPHGDIADTPAWAERRIMAEEWHHAFESFDLDLLPMLHMDATGANNGDLPTSLLIENEPHPVDELFGSINLLIAMTQFSATAPLSAFIRKYPHLRAASMPGVLKAMEQTALSANYREVARKVHLLAEKLTRADQARVEFASGDVCTFDLRYRRGMSDDGSCRPDSPSRLINLPSGEAFIVPYEGERPDEPSLTSGIIPVHYRGERIRLIIDENHIQSVSGPTEAACAFREMLSLSDARRNVAELGLGCNEAAMIRGSVLEDEKVGFHWAYGRSEHLGGTVSPADFADPAHVLHQDIVYAPGCPETVQSVNLTGDSGYDEMIIREGLYIFDSSQSTR